MNITHDNEATQSREMILEDKEKLFDKFLDICKAYKNQKASLSETNVKIFKLYHEAIMYGFTQSQKKS